MRNSAKLYAGGLVALAVLSAQACKSDSNTSATGITIAVYSDGVAGADYDKVALTVTREGQVKLQRDWPASVLPNTFAIEPAEGHSPTEPVEVTVEATKAGAPWARRSAMVYFHEGVNHLLRMPLCRSCSGVSCQPGVLTCSKGNCESSMIMISEQPVYDGYNQLDNGECSPLDGGAGAAGAAGAGGSGLGGSAGESGDCSPACQSPVPVCLKGTCVQCQFDTHCAASTNPCMQAKCGLDNTCKQTPKLGESCGIGRTCSAEGACVCDSGLSDCSGACYDLQQDTSNCGGCGVKCSGATPSCISGKCSAPRSCDGLPATCGPTQSESCCASALIPGGEAFPMGCKGGAEICSGNDQPEHILKPDSFWLDTYEVTVGRMRKYVESQPADVNTCKYPADGAGAHPDFKDSGWHAAWDSGSFSCSRSYLESSITKQNGGCTYTLTPGANENKPINCVNWFMSFAFCIWDGGRLATETEWEYAAAGGAENRIFPWGDQAPDTTRAIYGSLYNPFDPDAGLNPDYSQQIAPVGSRPAGKGRWGQYDLAGNVGEWVIDFYHSDWYSKGGAACTTNCVDLNGGLNDQRVNKGGDYASTAPERSLRAAQRLSNMTGIRCVRNP